MASSLAAGLRVLILQLGRASSSGGMQAEVRNKGARGVYGFSFWSLIECLEDKPGDISHPGGQRMEG